MNSSQRTTRTSTWFMMVSLLVTMVIAQTTTYLDVGGIFPLLSVTGSVDPVGIMRQAGKVTSCLFFASHLQ